MRTESIPGSLGGGWRLITRDPVGVLLPAAFLLGVQGVALWSVHALWGRLDLTWLTLAVVAVGAVRIALSAPLRALSLSAGARVLHRPFPVFRRVPGLAVVWLISAAVEALIVGGLLASTLAPAWWLVTRGTYWGALALIATTAPVAAIVGIAARTVFSYAIVEVTAGGRGPIEALGEGWRWVTRDFMGVIVILITGELLVALGSLLCGAGALPGTPYADLALLHRWAHREELP